MHRATIVKSNSAVRTRGVLEGRMIKIEDILEFCRVRMWGGLGGTLKEGDKAGLV